MLQINYTNICVDLYQCSIWNEGVSDFCVLFTFCVCLRVVVSNSYCAVFLFRFSSSYLPYVASFSGLSIFSVVFFHNPYE